MKQVTPNIMTRRKSSKKPPGKTKTSPDALMRLLAERMEACPDAESLNAQVIMPFVAALENVCGARGYVLNIYGETSNIVFTGDEADAEAVYKLVEGYLDQAGEG